MTPSQRLSTLATALLGLLFIGLAISVPLSLKSEAHKDASLTSLGDYQPVEPPLPVSRAYDHSASSERPLFFENRRAQIIERDDSEIATENEMRFEVSRVEAIIGGADGFSAGLRVSDQGSIIWVRRGQRIQNWTVSKITPDTVHLKNDEEDKTLRLYPKRQRVAGE